MREYALRIQCQWIKTRNVLQFRRLIIFIVFYLYILYIIEHLCIVFYGRIVSVMMAERNNKTRDKKKLYTQHGAYNYMRYRFFFGIVFKQPHTHRYTQTGDNNIVHI